MATKKRSACIDLPVGATQTSAEVEPSKAAAPASARLVPMMGIEETATLLDVSQTTIRRLINDGRLTAYRIGGQFRISQEDVRAFLEAVRHGHR